MTEALCSLIERAHRVLSKRDDVELALLFGSHARKRATPSSDVDIAVRAPASVLLDIAAAISAELVAEVDVVALEDATIPMQEALIRDSIVIFEAKPGTAAAWRTRTLIDLETDRPWYRRMRDAWLHRVAERGLLDGG